MSSDPTNPNPPPPPSESTAPPPAPPFGSSRAEWRAWRHQNRDYARASWGWGGWGIFWGGLLVVIGVYALLSNLGLLSWLRGDILWPSLLILLGIALIFRRGRWW